VLLHNGEDGTVPALPKLLAGIKARGYQMATVSELLKEGRPVYRKFAWE
jgi:peptidoglycan/xylan/chitin deacetylase (PgdA/CDA1 family)